MKRSEIDGYIDEAAEFFDRHGFRLPKFAFWSIAQWNRAGNEADEIRQCRLGWDITDFGSGKFMDVGLTLFTVRNGRPNDPASKCYCEKVMLVREGQLTPFHFHWQKTEDIINRSGGVLVIELFNSDADEQVTRLPVRISCDGVVREIVAGGKIELEPGESVTLVPRVYHAFYARKGSGHALVGEVSSVNDDASDNRFLKPIPRYPAIEPDAPRRHYLCNEYPSLAAS
jgi:D-lyxose ketol-isomerase